jgi:hypothetical protein
VKYDTVSKLWIERCTGPFLKEMLDLPIRQLEPVEELAQEQPSMAKADSVLKATLADGTKQAFILEFLTRWDEDKLLDLAQYTIFCKKKLRLAHGSRAHSFHTAFFGAKHL